MTNSDDSNLKGAEDAVSRLLKVLNSVGREAHSGAPQDAASGSPLPGDPGVVRRFGDFDLLRELGQGGMGIVYEARQRSLGNRRVALKVLPPYFSLNPARVARFRTEAVAASKVAHHGIVAVLGVGEHEGTHYLVQELIEGGRTLADFIREQRDAPVPVRPDYRLLAGTFAVIADALQATHEARVLHRDINPTNILLTPRGEPKVGDFGLAKDLECAGVTSTGSEPGTPSYKSPEQVEPSRGPVDARSDVACPGGHALRNADPCAGIPGRKRARDLREDSLSGACRSAHDPRGCPQ
ncbi:MAG: serine/threonine protein kinase [Candidatus Eisenbacteria bacterium]|nr:serine/threonine protein kinase [Candidatus Eisenbacteria bacterium]